MGLNITETYWTYGLADILYFPMTNTSARLTAGLAFAAGDVKVSKDGGAPANTTNLPTSLGNGLYSLLLTALEMSAWEVVVLIKDQDGPAFEDAVFRIQTALYLGHMNVNPTQVGGNMVAFELTGLGTGPAIKATGGVNAPGIEGIGMGAAGIKGTGGAAGIPGIQGQGNTTAPGIEGVGGATGPGVKGTGGATSGAGIEGAGVAGNSPGIKGAGQGSAPGLLGQGGATGDGIKGAGGATSGAAIAGTTVSGPGMALTASGEFAAVSLLAGGNQPGIKSQGAGSGAGALLLGGAANGNGLEVTAQGTGSGAVATSGNGATGDGFRAVAISTNGQGVYLKGTGTGFGLKGDGASANQYTNIFQTTEGTEPAGAIANNATFAAIMQHLKRRFFNKVTGTSAILTVFKDDSATTLFTKAQSNDGTTVTQLKAS